MRILLVNDDGFDAPGFEILRKIAHELSDDVWSVAPETDQSGVSHALTLSHPLRLRQLGEKDFVLRGSPTDCAIMGVRELLPGEPDLILSGVNHGQNAADDVTYSGTVAGAMEGALMGIKSIALSQRVDWLSGITHWDNVATHGARVVDKLLSFSFDDQIFLNVNFPDCPPSEVVGDVVVPQGQMQHGLHMEKRVDGRNKPYYWLRFAGREPKALGETDISALQEGKITITPLRPDLTDRDSLAELEHLVRGE